MRKLKERTPNGKKARGKQAARSKSRRSPTDHIIPGPVAPEALRMFSLKDRAFDGAEEISAYVEREAKGERVSYLEKINYERVFSALHETWDVHTDQDRYWVITNPTNLYSQKYFPSADYTLSFHVGLTARVRARRETRAKVDEQDRLSIAWRRWSQAGRSLDAADEAEDFQAIGMRCRECLIALVRDIADDSMIPHGQEAPKTADVVGWTKHIANSIARGASAERVRAYLKSVSKESWQLVSWLTHAASATRFDAELALEATHSTMVAFGAAMLRHERGTPDRCPNCSSYRVSSQFVDELDPPRFADVCQACGCVIDSKD